MTSKNLFLFLAVAGLVPFMAQSCSNGTYVDGEDFTDISENSSSLLSSSSETSSSDSEKPSSSSQDSTEMAKWPKDSVFDLSGYISRGMPKIGSSVLVEELDSALNKTGVKYTGIVDSAGHYVVRDVKFTSPLVLVSTSAPTIPLCYEDDRYEPTYIDALLDLRQGTEANLNSLTMLQTKAVLGFVRNGMDVEQARKKAYDDLRGLFLMDSVSLRFEQMNLVQNIEGNFYLLGVETMSPVYEFSQAYDRENFKELILADSYFGEYWRTAHGKLDDNDCFKLEAHVKSWKYTALIGKAKEYLKTINEIKMNFGECGRDNYGVVKKPFYSKDSSDSYQYFCDSTHWIMMTKFNCHRPMQMYIDTLPAGEMGEIIKAPYCTDSYFKYIGFWKRADQLDVGLKTACYEGTKDLYMSSGRKCYYCGGSSWSEPLPRYVDCDTVLHVCEKAGEVFKGIINPDSNYVCENSKPRKFNSRENAFNLACVASTEKQSFTVGKTTFTCDQGTWTVESGTDEENTLVDTRDGKTYRTVGLGDQRWMAENLDYYDTVTTAALKGSIFMASRTPDTSVTLYKGKVAQMKDICPKGYHVPSKDEWLVLGKFAEKYGLDTNMVMSLSSRKYLNTELNWKMYPYDQFGFSLQNTGYIASKGEHVNYGASAYLWVSDLQDESYLMVHADATKDSLVFIKSSLDAIHSAIRCVEDSEQ